MELANDLKIVRVMNAVAAGTSDQTSSAVDMQGFDGCAFLAAFGALTSGTVASVRAQQSADDGSVDTYADLKGSDQAVADTNSNKAVLLDIFRPQERYLKCVVKRATQNAVIDGVFAILYKSNKLPTVIDSTIVAQKLLVSPVEGTA